MKVLLINGSPRPKGNIALAKQTIGLPKKEEPRVWTNFFRD